MAKRFNAKEILLGSLYYFLHKIEQVDCIFRRVAQRPELSLKIRLSK